MEKVYVLFRGELHDSERMLGVYGSVHGAMAAAEALMEEEREEGMEFRSELTQRRGDRIEWRDHGHFIAVEGRQVL